MILVLVMFLAGIFADWLAPYELNDLHMRDRLLAPGGQYILGTDQLGRDLLSQTIYRARVSMIIGLSATASARSSALRLALRLATSAAEPGA